RSFRPELTAFCSIIALPDSYAQTSLPDRSFERLRRGIASLPFVGGSESQFVHLRIAQPAEYEPAGREIFSAGAYPGPPADRIAARDHGRGGDPPPASKGNAAGV